MKWILPFFLSGFFMHQPVAPWPLVSPYTKVYADSASPLAYPNQFIPLASILAAA